MIKTDIRKNDNVAVIAGRDKGKQGRVLDVNHKTGRVLVEHVMTVKKHVRPNPQRQIKGGIAESESPIQTSNLMLVCSSCGPVRIGHAKDAAGRRLKDASKRPIRVCRQCGTTIEKG